MLITEAFVSTERADRLLAQLSRHTSQMQRHFGDHVDERHEGDQRPRVEGVESSRVAATLTFAEGRCFVWVQPRGLKLRVEAQDDKNLRRIQDGVGRRLQTFSRNDRLQVAWSGAESSGD